MILLALDSISDRPGAAILGEDDESFLSLAEEWVAPAPSMAPATLPRSDRSERRDFGAPRRAPTAHLRTVMAAWGGDVARLDGAAVIVGPGSYTGLRSGLAALQGFLFGRPIRVAGIGTFDALLAASPDPSAIPVVRMRRTEWAVRRGQRAIPVDAAGLKELIAGRPVVALGELPEDCAATLLERTMSLAEATARLGLERAKRGDLVAIEEIRPGYLGSYADRG